MINLVKYVLQILRHVNPSTSLSADGKSDLNNIFIKLLVYLISNLKTTEDLSLLFGKDLYKYAIMFCDLNSDKYIKNRSIPNSVINKIIKYYNLETPVSLEFISCIGEYIMAEILEISATTVRSKRKVRITSSHLSEAINENNELKQLLKNINFVFTKNQTKRSRA